MEIYMSTFSVFEAWNSNTYPSQWFFIVIWNPVLILALTFWCNIVSLKNNRSEVTTDESFFRVQQKYSDSSLAPAVLSHKLYLRFNVVFIYYCDNIELWTKLWKITVWRKILFQLFLWELLGNNAPWHWFFFLISRFVMLILCNGQFLYFCWFIVHN